MGKKKAKQVNLFRFCFMIAGLTFSDAWTKRHPCAKIIRLLASSFYSSKSDGS